MARLPFFRWTVLPRCEESQKNGQHSARAASSLLDLALDLEATGFLVILVGPKLSMASEQSGSAGFLLASWVISPEHLRLAAFFLDWSPGSPVFRLAWSERQASLRVWRQAD